MGLSQRPDPKALAQAEEVRKPGFPFRVQAQVVATGGVHVRLPPRLTNSKRRSNAGSAVSWKRRAWQALATDSPSSRLCADPPRSGVTILARAAPEKSTRSAAARTPSTRSKKWASSTVTPAFTSTSCLQTGFLRIEQSFCYRTVVISFTSNLCGLILQRP